MGARTTGLVARGGDRAAVGGPCAHPWGGKTARSQSPDEGEPAPPYPQVMQKPEYQKSWDNILDHADFATHEADAESNEKISRPFRLMPFIRKLSERRGNWRNLFGAFKKDDAHALPADELTYTQEREVFTDEKPQQAESEPQPSAAYQSRFHEHLGAAPFPNHAYRLALDRSGEETSLNLPCRGRESKPWGGVLPALKNDSEAGATRVTSLTTWVELVWMLVLAKGQDSHFVFSPDDAGEGLGDIDSATIKGLTGGGGRSVG